MPLFLSLEIITALYRLYILYNGATKRSLYMYLTSIFMTFFSQV